MKFIKTFFKSMDVAFSLYSRIPMPRFNWASDDMKYHLCFFPWVGAVIGLFELGWYFLSLRLSLGDLFFSAIAVSIPLFITGGFHVDGFMDTMDALHSYQDREKKLEIMKDPHIGAFAVISLAICLLLAAGFASLVKTFPAALTVAFSFIISRALSGLSVTYFPKAKKEGMLYTEASASQSRVVGISLVLQLVISVAILLYLTLSESFCALFSLGCMAFVFVYYYSMSKRQFGGISGDLSGFFVVVAELASLMGTGLALLLGL
ncbi:MAG: adenosylcobinamide-GDP ribazoletransferase [Treponemataceae bacterium]|nr:adenosylcobinamide-GDP ribazoletransferase [Treponemataceae bacterium]